MAGAATAAEPASPTPAALRNSRRFISRFPSRVCRPVFRREGAAFFKRFVGPSPAADCADLTKQFAYAKRKRTRDHCDPGSFVLRRSERERYDRVRERIMKVSKVYSATCHQRY